MSSRAVPNPSERRVPEFTTTAVVTMQTVTPPTETVSLHKFDACLSATGCSCFGWVLLVHVLAAPTESDRIPRQGYEMASYPGSYLGRRSGIRGFYECRMFRMRTDFCPDRPIISY